MAIARTAKQETAGIFYTAGIASFTIPLITAKLSQISIASIIWFDFLIAVIGFVTPCTSAVNFRLARRKECLAPPSPPEVQRRQQ